jgi:ferredoxin
MVKNRQTGQIVPSCATMAVEGMEIESETDQLALVRRTALELLLSDHVGDCLAPCYFACPAHMDIPLMLQQIGDHHLRDAIATIKGDIALPAVLGRICSKPCEKGCRRGGADSPAAICQLKRFVADRDLESEDPYTPECKPPTGKRVAIIGAGPTGLAAAYELAQAGHACTLFDDQPKPGGRLRSGTIREQLPSEVLDAEIGQILRLGVELKSGCPIGQEQSPSEVLESFDATLVACGPIDTRQTESWGLKAAQRGIEVQRETYQTSRPGVFAAGLAIRGSGLVIRSVADGKEAAQSIDDFLANRPIRMHGRPFSSRMGRILPEEMSEFLADAAPVERHEPPRGEDFGPDDAAGQADRCLACGCIAHNHCKLEQYAQRYGANPGRFGGERPSYEVIGRDASVLFEPGKCIKCELCVQIAKRGGEPLGLAFVGRGFDVRLDVPFGGTLDEALTRVATECVAACPTAALTFAHQHGTPEVVPLTVAARDDKT